MYLFGFTINTLSLFCFVLVLGMIVDDAIIILENVYRHMEAGLPAIQAAVIGTEQVLYPVLSAVLTSIAAFLPLLLMEGKTGSFLWTMPVIVSIALAASLVEAFFALPSHIAEFGGLANHHKPSGDGSYHPAKRDACRDHKGDDKGSQEKDEGPEVIEKFLHVAGKIIPEQPFTDYTAAPVGNRFGEIQTQNTGKGYGQAEDGHGIFYGGGQPLALERENGHGDKGHHQPEG